MKIHTAVVRTFLLVSMAVVTFAGTARRATAQEKPKADSTQSAAKNPAPPTKQQLIAASEKDPDKAEEKTENSQEKDSPDLVKKRMEWFYKQRASAKGHIPAAHISGRFSTCSGCWSRREDWFTSLTEVLWK